MITKKTLGLNMKPNKYYLYCLLTILFFSTLEVAGKLFGGGIHPIAITGIRFLIGSVLLSPFAMRQIRERKIKFKATDILLIGLVGSLNVGVSMLALQYAILYGKASLAALLISSNPIFVAIFGLLILHEKLKTSTVIGIILGLFGMGIIIGFEDSLFSGATNPLLGLTFGLVSAISFGLYTVYAKRYAVKFGGFVFNSISFFVGGVVLLLAGLGLGFDLSFPLTLNNSAYLLYLGTFVTGLAYMLYFEGLKNIPTAIGSSFFYLKPAFALILAYLFLGEKIILMQVVGFILVVISLSLGKKKVK
ncbi:MAG: hypothetical protein B6226_01185 [Candidatus Cloacimonetes bacterium 4572_65]|nr:MAG: hypothetical protein B6226_01185 [Candidatus Cloacimonetes bacterium 4572_65]